MHSGNLAKNILTVFGGLLMSACPQQGDMLVQNDTDTNIYNRFTTKEVLSSTALPERVTRIKFFPHTSEFLILGQGGEVFHFFMEQDSARWRGSFIVPEVAPGPVEIGLTDVAFDPQFHANGYVYFCLLGKLIRILPQHTGGYEIPANNPYRGVSGVRGEIAAFGLRSPFRMLVWRDYVLLAEVGANRFEEIDLYTGGRINFGWPECEGMCDRSEFQNPILAIGHHDPAYQLENPEPVGELRHAIALGVLYESRDQDPYLNLLAGRLLFNDVFLGYVRAAQLSPSGELRDNKHIFHKVGVTSMDIGPGGYIFGSTIFPAQVFRVELKGPEF
jgi:hypothetical protein